MGKKNNNLGIKGSKRFTERPIAPWVTFFFLVPIMGMAQNTLSVSVAGVSTSEGTVKVAVYAEEEGFLQLDGAIKSESAKAKKGITKVSISDLPPGEYALAVFHDENDNDILDSNWLGIPKERVCFSKARMKTFGPPDFKDCAFSLISDKSITVSF
ncbi:MAG: DUF2141 domain-containing protein [Bacteroidota bacterium]